MHTCPRRSEGGPFANRPTVEGGDGPDDYTSGHGLVGQPRGCTYCGSMSPDDFMAAVRDGAEVGPTDKSYKVYVKGLPADDPDKLWVTSSSSSSSSGLTHYSDLTPVQRAAVDARYHAPYPADPTDHYYGGFIKRPTVDGKFYFGHMSPEQGSEFKTLYEAGRVNMGYPGHFYRPVSLPLLPEDQGAQS